MPLLIGGLLILGSALVSTAQAEGGLLPPVHIFMQVAAAPDIEEMVRDTQRDYGLSDSFYNTLKCESNFENIQSLVPDVTGPNGREDSWGVAQIHLTAHTDVTREEALDPAFAIPWAAQQFKMGNAELWTCYRNLVFVQ